MKVIKNLSDLERIGQLRPGDLIKIYIDKIEYQFEVALNHLHAKNCDVDKFFNELGIIDKYEYCTAAYGYPAQSGIFPRCKLNDNPAMLRVVTRIYQDLKKRKI